MRKIAAAAVLAGALAGCVSTSESVTPTESYESSLAAYAGFTAGQLIAAWGEPDHTYVTAGLHTFYVYEQVRTETMSAPATAYPPGGMVTIDLAQNAETFRCTTTFDLVRFVVVAWAFEGNDCVLRASQ